MAYDVSKLTKLGALKQMAERIAADYATKKEVTAAVNAKISSVYKAGGSVTFANLPLISEDSLGLVVNVTEPFVTNGNFVEGGGNAYPAGTNVVVVETGDEHFPYAYDVLSGFVDLSGYVEKEDGKGLSANDFTDADKEKLDGIKIASDEEVTEMLAEVFGAEE